MAKGERLESVNKGEISDGIAKNKPVVYVTGGVFFHLVEVLEMLERTGTVLTDEQLEDLIMKMAS